ncbi:2-dehydro-3-deoxygalactonokinase [Acetobacteraceae bacterium H6797]|nr:2-dehydro-3-deoxygalactonokinase [Acetobacteraceae bacterium H6797]
MNAAGQIVAQRSSAHGIVNLPEPGATGFERAFEGVCGDWLAAHHGLPVVAGGMVGSAQGWREAAYIPCPADLRDLASRPAEVTTAKGVRILIAPGVLHTPSEAAPDVIRGEEIQIAGALAERPELVAGSHFVMPGTHSKWVEVREGRITRFATYMTGEVFAVLCQHSLLGRLMTAEEAPSAEGDAAFAQGVAMAKESGPGDFAHQIFAARTLGLTKGLAPAQLKPFLSGLLIGHELVSALGKTERGTKLAMIGEGALCARYAQGLALLGAPPPISLGNTAPGGLFRFALAAGLLQHVKEAAP